MFEPNKNEERILSYWKEHDTLNKLRQRNREKKVFYFLDGPPYVTGDLHPGHIWVKTLKDLFVRYKRYRGFNVVDRAGYDVHGLPIENKVEKELGIVSKKEIETRIGVEQFVKECRKYVEKYVGRMDADYERYGISLNFKDPYLPYTNEYMETAWWMFKRAAERGFLYEGKKTLIYCPHCETPLSQGSMEVEYKDVDDPSMFVAFRVDKTRSKAHISVDNNTYLLVWTTTPWTLPANVAVAANPKATYVLVEMKGRKLILAKERLDNFTAMMNESVAILAEFPASDLEGIYYVSPLENKVEKQKELRKYHKVIFSEELVSVNEGTGLLHTAPGHGIEDYQLGLKNKLPIFSPVAADATYNDEAGTYKGLKVPLEANKVILQDLETAGALLHIGTLKHSYPHCWRCSSKLIFIATNQWFFNVQKIKKKLIAQNERTNWHPGEVKGWQNSILENSPDWCVSRQRYWGIPMPIWRCNSCGKMTIIESIAELREKAVNKSDVDALHDVHRPYIDRIKIKCECGSHKERIKDILDVWFDSSSAFRASLTAEQFGKFSSTELIAEYIEQIRGWFQYMLKNSMMVYGKKPFNHIVVHGILFGLDGRKMSKSFGNYKPLSEMTKMVSADAFRLWCVNYNPILNRNLNEIEIKDTEKAITILYNISNLISEYQEAVGSKPVLKRKINTRGLDEIDAWIVSRVESLTQNVTKHLDNYEAFKATSEIKSFVIEDLSRFYLKLAKKRILSSEKKKAKTIMNITYYVLYKTLILTSVFTPFIAETVYLDRYAMNESIFFERWPKANASAINQQLEEDMEAAKDAITALLNSREKANISLRWPIARATVEVKDDASYASLQKLKKVVEDAVNTKAFDLKRAKGAKEEVKPLFAKLGPAFKEKAGAVAQAMKNVDVEKLKSSIASEGKYRMETSMGHVVILPEHFDLVEIVEGEGKVLFRRGTAYVDTTINKELKEEAMLREFERSVQLARKEMALRKGDRISLSYRVPHELEGVLKKHEKQLKKDVGATSVSKVDQPSSSFVKEVEIEDEKIAIGLDKA